MHQLFHTSNIPNPFVSNILTPLQRKPRNSSPMRSTDSIKQRVRRKSVAVQFQILNRTSTGRYITSHGHGSKIVRKNTYQNLNRCNVNRSKCFVVISCLTRSSPKSAGRTFNKDNWRSAILGLATWPCRHGVGVFSLLQVPRKSKYCIPATVRKHRSFNGTILLVQDSNARRTGGITGGRKSGCWAVERCVRAPASNSARCWRSV